MGKTKKDSKKKEVKDNSKRIAQFTEITVNKFLYDFQDASVDDVATLGADVILRLAPLVKDFYKGESDLEKIENAINHMIVLVKNTLVPPEQTILPPEEPVEDEQPAVTE